MEEKKKQLIEQALKTISWTAPRVLIANCYEGYEYRRLKEALKLLTEEVNSK